MSGSAPASTAAMRLSLLASFITLVLKFAAYQKTGSAAILGDAAESVVHLAAVFFAAYSLWLAQQPADENHRYGHSKIAFFSAGLEGSLIVLTAAFLLYQSIHYFLNKHELTHLSMGAALTASTIFINLSLGLYLVGMGRRQKSIILEANGKHVMTDAITSLGALLGLALVHWHGWYGWDPICGILLSASILLSGFHLLRQSISGLMDHADPALTHALDTTLQRETRARQVRFHALRHRNAGHVHYVDVHLLFPDDIPLRDAHRIATEIECAVVATTEVTVHITTHLECIGDHNELHPDDPIQ